MGGAAAVGVFGLTAGLALAPIAAAGAAVASTQSGGGGDAVRAVTGAGVQAHAAASNINQQYGLTGKAGSAATAIVGTATQVNNDYDVTGKASKAAHDSMQWAEDHHVAERLGEAAGAVGAAAGDAVAWAEQHQVAERASAAASDVGAAGAAAFAGLQGLLGGGGASKK